MTLYLVTRTIVIFCYNIAIYLNTLINRLTHIIVRVSLLLLTVLSGSRLSSRNVDYCNCLCFVYHKVFGIFLLYWLLFQRLAVLLFKWDWYLLTKWIRRPVLTLSLLRSLTLGNIRAKFASLLLVYECARKGICV